MKAVMIKRGPGRPKKRNARGLLYKPRTILLDDELVNALDDFAEAEGLENRSAVVRTASREFLRKRAKRAAREAETV